MKRKEIVELPPESPTSERKITISKEFEQNEDSKIKLSRKYLINQFNELNKKFTSFAHKNESNLAMQENLLRLKKIEIIFNKILSYYRYSPDTFPDFLSTISRYFNEIEQKIFQKIEQFNYHHQLIAKWCFAMFFINSMNKARADFVRPDFVQVNDAVNYNINFLFSAKELFVESEINKFRDCFNEIILMLKSDQQLIDDVANNFFYVTECYRKIEEINYPIEFSIEIFRLFSRFFFEEINMIKQLIKNNDNRIEEKIELSKIGIFTLRINNFQILLELSLEPEEENKFIELREELEKYLSFFYQKYLNFFNANNIQEIIKLVGENGIIELKLNEFSRLFNLAKNLSNRFKNCYEILLYGTNFRDENRAIYINYLSWFNTLRFYENNVIFDFNFKDSTERVSKDIAKKIANNVINILDERIIFLRNICFILSDLDERFQFDRVIEMDEELNEDDEVSESDEMMKWCFSILNQLYVLKHKDTIVLPRSDIVKIIEFLTFPRCERSTDLYTLIDLIEKKYDAAIDDVFRVRVHTKEVGFLLKDKIHQYIGEHGILSAIKDGLSIGYFLETGFSVEELLSGGVSRESIRLAGGLENSYCGHDFTFDPANSDHIDFRIIVKDNNENIQYPNLANFYLIRKDWVLKKSDKSDEPLPLFVSLLFSLPINCVNLIFYFLLINSKKEEISRFYKGRLGALADQSPNVKQGTISSDFFLDKKIKHYNPNFFLDYKKNYTRITLKNLALEVSNNLPKLN